MKHPITKQTLEIIRSYSYEHGMSLSEYGRKAGVSKAWLSKLKNTDANLSVETAADLLDIAGYKLSITKGKDHSAELDDEYKTNKISRLKKVIECQNM